MSFLLIPQSEVHTRVKKSMYFLKCCLHLLALHQHEDVHPKFH